MSYSLVPESPLNFAILAQMGDYFVVKVIFMNLAVKKPAISWHMGTQSHTHASTV